MREMKNSGIEWIGDIPSGWKVCKLKNIIKFLNGYAFDSGVLKSDGLYPVIRIGDIINGKVDFSKANKIDEYNELLNRFTVAPNDVVIAMSGATVGKLGYIENVEVKSFINQRVGIIRSNMNKFVFYYLSSEAFLKYIQLLSEGTAQPNISTENINNFYITQPSKAEIDRIVSVLDKKCAEIDTVIEKTKATIEEYKKLKQSVITQAVTKGIRPNRPMKDSGIEWIGEIPADWDIKRGKAILNLLEKPVKESDSVITCFRDGQVTLRSNRREDGFTFSLQEVGYQGIDVGDLVVHGMDGFAGAIGISDSRGKATPVLNVMDSTENKRYIMYYLRCMAFNGVFIALATGIRVRSCDTNWNKLKNLPYIVPSHSEQQEIVDYIDRRCFEVDDLIAKKTALLSELENYKKSLIYEYVTGKKEV